jgi:uncharacterized phage protein gp47/JayE
MPILTIEQYLNEIQTDLLNQNSILGNFVIGTNLYIVLRAISEIFSRRDIKIKAAIDNTSILSAQGDYLDAIGLTYGLVRSLGVSAKGYVIGEGYNGELVKGTIIETLDSTRQYKIEESVLLSNRVSRSFKVQSVLKSVGLNVNAGTSLKAPTYPNLQLTVGRFRDSQGNAIESITGGEGIESDLDFRIRILNLLQGSFLVKGSYLNIYTALNTLLPEYSIDIIEDVPVGGVFTVYVDKLDSTVEQTIKDSLEFNKPIGSRYEIKLLEYSYIDLEMKVIGNINTDLDTLRQQITDLTNIYFSNKTIGQLFNKSELIGLLNSQLSVNSLNITFPLEDISNPGSNKKIRLNNLVILLSK